MGIPGAAEIVVAIRDAVVFEDGEPVIRDLKRFRDKHLDALVDAMSRHSDESTRTFLVWILTRVAQVAGIVPASLQTVYAKKSKGDLDKITIPCLCPSEWDYKRARSWLRAAAATNCRAFISAKPITSGVPGDLSTWSALMVSAALREGFSGPLFLQLGPVPIDSGDRQNMLNWLDSAVAAGIYNFDLDASESVDATGATFEDQHRRNFETTMQWVGELRSRKLEGVEFAIGATLATPSTRTPGLDDVRAYMDGLVRTSGGESRLVVSKVSLLGLKAEQVAPPPFVPGAEGPRAPWLIESFNDLVTSAYKVGGVCVVTDGIWRDTALDHLHNSSTTEWRFSEHPEQAEALFKRLGSASTLEKVADNVEAVKLISPLPEPFQKLVRQ